MKTPAAPGIGVLPAITVQLSLQTALSSPITSRRGLPNVLIPVEVPPAMLGVDGYRNDVTVENGRRHAPSRLVGASGPETRP